MTFACNPCECGGSPECRTFSVGMFFEKVETIKAETLEHARKEADKWAEGIADKEELTITHVEVIEAE